MRGRTKSQRHSYGRNLQLEPLENRCMLSLTALVSVDAGSANDAPVPDCDVVIVAKALPTSDGSEIVCNGDGDQLVDCVVNDADPTSDEATIADNRPQFYFDWYAVDRTIDEKLSDGAPGGVDIPTGVVPYTLDQQDADDCIPTDAPTGDAEPINTAGPVETLYSVIDFVDQIAETTVSTGTDSTDEVRTPTPIVLHTENTEATSEPVEAPQSTSDEPVIYTLGGESSGNNNTPAGNADRLSAPPVTTAKSPKSTRAELRMRKLEQLRAKENWRDDALVALLAAPDAPAVESDTTSELPTNPSKPTEPSVKLPGVGFLQLVGAIKKKGRGHKSH